MICSVLSWLPVSPWLTIAPLCWNLLIQIEYVILLSLSLSLSISLSLSLSLFLHNTVSSSQDADIVREKTKTVVFYWYRIGFCKVRTGYPVFDPGYPSVTGYLRPFILPDPAWPNIRFPTSHQCRILGVRISGQFDIRCIPSLYHGLT